MKKATNKKPHVIVLYGAMAVGKLTVGKALAKKLGYKLTHNHLVTDLVSSVFERGTFERNFLIENLRYEFYDVAVALGHSLVITHCYAHNFVSATGLSDPQYLKDLEKRLEKAGAKVLFIHLQADQKVLLKRIKGGSRKKHGKLMNASIMKKFLKEKDFTTSAPVKNDFVIDNSKLSPKKVVEMIIKYNNSH